MKPRSSVLLASLVFAFGLAPIHEGPVAAQTSPAMLSDRAVSTWENDRFRVRPISVAPGAQGPESAAGDAVLVLFTADWEGRMPAAEAIWQPAGGAALQNRGRAPVEGLLIELKDATTSGGAGTPPEARPVVGEVDVRSLIDNARVSVMRQRYARGAYSTTTWQLPVPLAR